MATKRRIHSAAFKAKVALEALKGERTLNEIGKTYEVHPLQVSAWKKALLEGASTLFERNVSTGESELQGREAPGGGELSEKKVGDVAMNMRLSWVNANRRELSVAAQCALLQVPRST